MESGHGARIDAGVSFDWATLPPLTDTLDAVPDDTTRLYFQRRGNSHRGLGRLAGLRQLWFRSANQEAMDHIASLPVLETLFIDEMSASDLSPLARNQALRRLILRGGTKVTNLEWLAALSPTLEILMLTRFTRVSSLEHLAALSGLRSLGFEGGMDVKADVDTLGPLGDLGGLANLFLASTRVADRSLSSLHRITSLKRLECGAYFPDSEFVALHKALSDLSCDWIDMIEKHGSIRSGMAALRKRLSR